MSDHLWRALDEAIEGLPPGDRASVEKQCGILAGGFPDKELTKWFSYVLGQIQGSPAPPPDPRDLTVEEFVGMVHLLSLFLGIVRMERVNWSELTGGPPDEDVLSRAATLTEASTAAQRPAWRVWSAMMELLREERDRRVGV